MWLAKNGGRKSKKGCGRNRRGGRGWLRRREKLEERLRQKQEEVAVLTKKWEEEKAKIDEIKSIKEDLEKARQELEQAQREGNFARASELRYSTIPSLQEQLPREGEDDPS